MYTEQQLGLSRGLLKKSVKAEVLALQPRPSWEAFLFPPGGKFQPDRVTLASHEGPFQMKPIEESARDGVFYFRWLG